MRSLIPRLHVVMARDALRAGRLLGALTPGQEVYLTPLTPTLLKVCDQEGAASARVLGVIPPEASDRIRASEASGRPCRAWFVDHVPAEDSSDGSFQMVLSVWCSSLTAASGGWRDLTLEELRETVRRAARHDLPPASAGRLAQSSAAPSGTRPDGSDPGLTPGQLDRIKDAVRRKLGGDGC